MRISEVARLAGVSARSIRHYHRLGILAEPARTSGDYRDYEVADLVRVMHIRYLSEAGIPLRQVPRILDDRAAGETLEHEIAMLSESLTERIESLEQQRAKLGVISDRVGAGEPIQPLPADIRAALDICVVDAEGDARLVRDLGREREMFELLALSAPGAFPEPLVAAYRTIARDGQARAEYLDGLRRFGALENKAPSAVMGEIDALAAKLASNENLRVLVQGAPPDDGGGAGPGVGDLLPDAAQQAVIERLFERLRAGDS